MQIFLSLTFPSLLNKLDDERKKRHVNSYDTVGNLKKKYSKIESLLKAKKLTTKRFKALKIKADLRM